ncbi:MAG: glycosyltransferase family 2 protein [Tepidisphaeraceae bacterium]
MKLVVTIPAQNEEKTIAQVVAGVPRNLPGISETEVIVMDDGSTDATARLAREAGAIVVPIHGRPGLGKVFKTGMDRAMRRGADIICNIDGDGQFNPGDIAKLVIPLLSDDADFVTCSRFKDPSLWPTMPAVKFWGNKVVTRMINWVCGGTTFSDVSCGFRAFSREAAYRLTLFGRYTYTQECFIDLFSKGMRIVEVPLAVRGVREHGKSRVAGSVLKYATNSLPIIIRAMRDIQPLKFFGGIAATLAVPCAVALLFVAGWYAYTAVADGRARTSPFTQLITIAGIGMVISFLMGMLALLADMMGRHRRISEELLYLARKKLYQNRRPPKPSVAVAHTSHRLSLHDSWVLPVIKSVPEDATSKARDDDASIDEVEEEIAMAAAAMKR